MLTVTEPGLYRLIFKSRKPVAKRFQRWVLHEVLPSIRKIGKYEIPQPQNIDLNNTFAGTTGGG
jgi:prophage antirepressor-like protein